MLCGVLSIIVTVVLIVRILNTQTFTFPFITIEMSGGMKEKIQEIVSGVQEYPVKSKSFWLPDLEQVASYVELELKKNYSNVLVLFPFLLRL